MCPMSATPGKMDPGWNKKELLLLGQALPGCGFGVLGAPLVPLLFQDSLSFLQGGFSSSSLSLFDLCVRR